MSNQFSPFPILSRLYSQHIDCHFAILDETPSFLAPRVFALSYLLTCSKNPACQLACRWKNWIISTFSRSFSFCCLFHLQSSRSARSFPLVQQPESSHHSGSCSVLRNSRCTTRREWEEVSSRENTCDREGAVSNREHLFPAGPDPCSRTPPLSRLESTEQEASPASQSTAWIGNNAGVGLSFKLLEEVLWVWVMESVN